MLTLKASIKGLELIQEARNKEGLTIDNDEWLEKASKVLDEWEGKEYFGKRVSLSTFKRFIYAYEPIGVAKFKAFCQVLGLNWEEIMEQDNESPGESPLYVQRKSIENIEYIETQCYEEIKKPGALIRIKAPEKMGKTWLLEKVLDFSRKQGYDTVKLDFRLADHAIFSDYEKFLQWICGYVADSLDLEENLDNYWRQRYSNNHNGTRYFQDYLLNNVNHCLVLGLDNLDLVFEQSEFFNNITRLIRCWNDEARSTNHDISETWKKIRLVIVHSTEIYRGMDINSSPLAGVGLVVELPEFQFEQVLFLVQQHGLNWNTSNIDKLMTLIGGNPALVRIAVDSAKQQNLSVEEILESAATEAEVFRNHLGRHLDNLQKHPELASEFSRCVSDQEPVEIDSQIAFKLQAMGLVKLRENCVIPSCNLYRQYFTRVLHNHTNSINKN